MHTELLDQLEQLLKRHREEQREERQIFLEQQLIAARSEIEQLLGQHREEQREERRIFLEQQRLAAERERERRRSFRDNLAIVIAILSATVAFWQGYLAHEAGKDAARSADAAEQAIVLGQRAYLGVDARVVTKESDFTAGLFTLHVTGNTPAFDVKGFFGCTMLSGHDKGIDVDKLPEVDPAKQSLLEFPVNVLIPGATAVKRCGVHAQLRRVPLFAPAEVTIFVLRGRITYRDVLSKAHENYFCFRSSVQASDDEMFPCKSGNDAD